MIWAVDLDDSNGTALRALLYPKSLDWAYPSNPTNGATSASSFPATLPSTVATVAAPGPTQIGASGSCTQWHLTTQGKYLLLSPKNRYSQLDAFR